MSPLSFTPPANTDPVKELGKLKSIYPSMNYHITSGDTEQVTEKLDKGLLDFAVICEPPDERKYDYSAFPEADIWGAVMPSGHPLARKLLLQ